ncbi:MAG: hypothetical protein MPJ05_01620 [Nitrosopumilus sp.]|nr:hypothetical protein [Nitrosopumilus sp.]
MPDPDKPPRRGAAVGGADPPGSRLPLHDCREALWGRIYGSKPMPRPEPGAGMRYAGSVCSDLNLTRADIDAALEEIDEQ